MDFGGVINDGSSHPSGDDTAFLSGGYEEAMATPMMAGATESLERLNELFEGRVWVISKCGPRIQERTEQWLTYRHFFEATGIEGSHVRFCRRRPDKAIHCAELGVTHFIDDRIDVLRNMIGLVENLYLFGSSTQQTHQLQVISVGSWSDAESAIASSATR